MKALLAYVLMVGLPVAGILGILRAGEGLAAPAAVHGTWRLASVSVDGGPCAALAGLREGTMVEVEQSGPHLTARVADGGARLSGAIDGDCVSASASSSSDVSSDDDGCREGAPLSLEATVEAGARPGR